MLFGILSCKEALQRLDDYLDRELTPEETRRVQRHLKLCRACATKFATEARFLEEMRGKLERLEVPSHLKNSISALLAQEQNGE